MTREEVDKLNNDEVLELLFMIEAENNPPKDLIQNAYKR